MAKIYIYDEKRELTGLGEIRTFLEPYDILYEKLRIIDSVDLKTASDKDILKAYANEIAYFKTKDKFIKLDVINILSKTPEIYDKMAPFRKEHTHDKREFRFTVGGNGFFSIHPKNGSVFVIWVQAGDLIDIPADTRHWFNLLDDDFAICTIRLFLDETGWKDNPVSNPIHDQYPIWPNREEMPATLRV